MNEDKVLAYDPFSGDFEGGGCGDRVLKDKMVTARKEAKCFICKETIKPKDRIRTIVEVYDDELMTFKFCTQCCEAMESEDADEILDNRHREDN
jgi:hypothetical protein